MLSEVVLAYAAGYFDGDGAIVVTRGHGIRCTIDSVDMSPLEFFKTHFGGCIKGPYIRSETSKPVHRWDLDGLKAVSFMTKVLPFSIIKKERLVLGSRFVRSVNEDSTFVEMRKLNQRGDLSQKPARVLKDRVSHINWRTSGTISVSSNDRAYIAGLFDGEGAVSIVKTASGLGSLRCIITNTHFEVLKYVQERFGGSVSSARTRVPGRKDAYNWTADARIAEEFLSIVRPFLVLKQERADLALQFRTLFSGQNSLPRGREAKSEINQSKRARVLAQRTAAFERMKALNVRGIHYQSDSPEQKVQSNG